jgi:squalene-associated FAD-dependent desaturase
MWRPLCLAALNTPPERASAQVFLAVLRDSLGAARAASDMLLPRLNLHALFPNAAASFVEQRGGTIHCGAKVASISRDSKGWQVGATGNAVGGSFSELFDAVVLAVPPPAAATLLEPLPLDGIGQQLAAFEYEPITTCYLQYRETARLELPFFALVDDPAAGHWGQFVFDRSQLDEGQPGLFSVVVSASAEAAALDQAALAGAIAAQLAAVFGQSELSSPAWSQVITEKRATFACTPGLQRLPATTGLDGLVLAGDYTASDYPATLETAVRSGAAAAKAIIGPTV